MVELDALVEITNREHIILLILAGVGVLLSVAEGVNVLSKLLSKYFRNPFKKR